MKVALLRHYTAALVRPGAAPSQPLLDSQGQAELAIRKSNRHLKLCTADLGGCGLDVKRTSVSAAVAGLVPAGRPLERTLVGEPILVTPPRG